MVSVDIKVASVRNAVRLIDIIIANYYKSHNNQQKLAVIVYHNATLRALTRHFRGFFQCAGQSCTDLAGERPAVEG
ncbi:hypothetical protein [Photorhabdus khanii]|uniref:hypothetical protein n=1 Tax=Photorhabdus khanii TaxID=1004150 RepID=UPI0013969BD7|nr:hypothetical protein [Photorhabdus khanii]